MDPMNPDAPSRPTTPRPPKPPKAVGSVSEPTARTLMQVTEPTAPVTEATKPADTDTDTENTGESAPPPPPVVTKPAASTVILLAHYPGNRMELELEPAVAVRVLARLKRMMTGPAATVVTMVRVNGALITLGRPDAVVVVDPRDLFLVAVKAAGEQGALEFNDILG